MVPKGIGSSDRAGSFSRHTVIGMRLTFGDVLSSEALHQNVSVGGSFSAALRHAAIA